VDFANFSKTELFSVNIHELRKLGQIVGVKSPSSLKKEELVDKIYEIVTGVKEPNIKKDKRGRPSKNIDFNIYANGIDATNPFGLARGVASSANQTYSNTLMNSHHLKGVFMSNGSSGKVKKFPYVDSPDDAFVSSNLIASYGLRDFDVIEFSLINGSAMVKEVGFIFTVNGKRFSPDELIFNQLERVDNFKTVQTVIGDKKVNIKRGGRTLVYAGVNYETTAVSDALVTRLSSNPKNVVIKLNLDKERIGDIAAPNVKVFSSLVIDSVVKALNEIDSAFSAARSQAVAGGNVYIVIDSLEALVDVNNKEKQSAGITEVKRDLFLAGAFENGSTISIICFSNGEVKKSPYSEVINYFNSKNEI